MKGGRSSERRMRKMLHPPDAERHPRRPEPRHSESGSWTTSSKPCLPLEAIAPAPLTTTPSYGVEVKFHNSKVDVTKNFETPCGTVCRGRRLRRHPFPSEALACGVATHGTWDGDHEG